MEKIHLDRNKCGYRILNSSGKIRSSRFMSSTKEEGAAARRREKSHRISFYLGGSWVPQHFIQEEREIPQEFIIWVNHELPTYHQGEERNPTGILYLGGSWAPQHFIKEEREIPQEFFFYLVEPWVPQCYIPVLFSLIQSPTDSSNGLEDFGMTTLPKGWDLWFIAESSCMTYF